MSNLYTLDIGIMEQINGRKIKALKPDSDGFYKVNIGALGLPSKTGKLYFTPSMISAMADKESSFYTQLTAGTLSGEYGHPIIPPDTPKIEMLRRMALIKETNKSHFFRRIWVNNEEAYQIDGFHVIPLSAYVKPIGPYGPTLKEELEDPHHDTSFSHRVLATPMLTSMPGTDPNYINLFVKVFITSDAVYAPGMSIASKRYAPHTENYGMDINFKHIEEALCDQNGIHLENYTGINAHDIAKLRCEEVIHSEGRIIGRKIMGPGSLKINNKHIDAASLIYGGR